MKAVEQNAIHHNARHPIPLKKRVKLSRRHMSSSVEYSPTRSHRHFIDLTLSGSLCLVNHYKEHSNAHGSTSQTTAFHIRTG